MSDPAPITPPPTPAPSSPGLGLGINHAIAHAAPQPPKSSPLNDRVGEILGYRLCDNCGFQLMGTPVVREPSYGLLLARCPECGHVHPASEPPQDSKRRSAFAHLASLGLIALKLGVLVLIATIFIESRESFNINASGGYTFKVRSAYDQYFAELVEKTGDITKAYAQEGFNFGTGSTPPARPSTYNYIGTAWWQDNRERLLREAGGPFMALTPYTVFAMANLPFVFFLTAPIMVLMTPRSSRWVLALLLTLVGLIAAAWPLIVSAYGLATPYSPQYYPFYTADPIIMHQLQPTIIALYASGSVFSAALAALFARPLARLVVRGFLRPELRGPFVELWTTAGLNPPRLTWPAHAPRPRTARS